MIAHEADGVPGLYSSRKGPGRTAFVRLCTHYFGNHAWLRDGQLLDDVDRIAAVPGRMIHGRHDLSCPAATAQALAEAWPAARLTLVEDAGHTGSVEFGAALGRAIDDFAALLG